MPSPQLLLAGGATAATLTMQQPLGAQVAQNAHRGPCRRQAPRPGAPMSFADLAAKLAARSRQHLDHLRSVQVNQGGGNPFAGTPFDDLFGPLRRRQPGRWWRR